MTNLAFALLTNLEQLERDGTAARLRAIAATLTAEEHQRLAAEAASGDRLAQLIVAVLASLPRTRRRDHSDQRGRHAAWDAPENALFHSPHRPACPTATRGKGIGLGDGGTGLYGPPRRAS